MHVWVDSGYLLAEFLLSREGRKNVTDLEWVQLSHLYIYIFLICVSDKVDEYIHTMSKSNLIQIDTFNNCLFD